MSFVRILWRGEIPLPRTYWLYGVLFVSLLSIPGYVIDFAIARSPGSEPSASLAFGAAAYAAFVLAYTVFISVAIWRSADKFKGAPIWAVLARVMVVIGLVQAAFQIVPV